MWVRGKNKQLNKLGPSCVTLQILKLKPSVIESQSSFCCLVQLRISVWVYYYFILFCIPQRIFRLNEFLIDLNLMLIRSLIKTCQYLQLASCESGTVPDWTKYGVMGRSQTCVIIGIFCTGASKLGFNYFPGWGWTSWTRSQRRRNFFTIHIWMVDGEIDI